MANKLVYVDPVGPGYPSLSAAVTGEVSANYSMINMAGILTIGTMIAADTTVVPFGNFSCNATYYAQVEAITDYRHLGVWDETKYHLAVSAASASALSVQSAHSRFRYLQIRNSGTDGRSVSASGSGYNKFIGCIFRGTVDLYADGNVFNNCIFLDPTYYANLLVSGSGTHRFINCTFVSSTGLNAVYSYGSSALHFTNCYFAGSADLFVIGDTSTHTFTTCACSTAETATGLTSSVTFDTNNFVNITFGNADFLKIKTTGALADVGTDMTADGNWYTGSNIDIAGQTRSTWDIGAWEAVASGTPSMSLTAPDTYGILVEGTYTDATPSGIEANFDGQGWVEIDASPTGGTFSAYLDGLTAGTGNLVVRLSDATSVTATRTGVTVGETGTGASPRVGDRTGGVR